MQKTTLTVFYTIFPSKVFGRTSSLTDPCYYVTRETDHCFLFSAARFSLIERDSRRIITATKCELQFIEILGIIDFCCKNRNVQKTDE